MPGQRSISLRQLTLFLTKVQIIKVNLSNVCGQVVAAEWQCCCNCNKTPWWQVGEAVNATYVANTNLDMLLCDITYFLPKGQCCL